jgi:hypothetical protein
MLEGRGVPAPGNGMIQQAYPPRDCVENYHRVIAKVSSQSQQVEDHTSTQGTQYSLAYLKNFEHDAEIIFQ